MYERNKKKAFGGFFRTPSFLGFAARVRLGLDVFRCVISPAVLLKAFLVEEDDDGSESYLQLLDS